MFLEARTQALEDLHAVGHGRLDHVDLLEAASQRAVLLEHAAVFLERGRTDAAQFTRRQHRLDQVRGVHGAAGGGTGADDGVDLVDEQDRAGLLLQLGDHALQPLLEIAAVLGAGHQRTQVQRPDRGALKHLGHLTIDDALGQAFGQRGLAHAGLADIERVVLAPAAEHLDGALDLVGTADQRVDLAFQRQFVEVAGELVQRVALGLAALLALALAAGHAGRRLVADLGDAVRDVIDHVEPGDLLLVHEEHRMRILLAEDGDQHVGAGDLLAAGRLHVIDGALQHPLEPQGGLRVALVARRQHRHGLADDAGQLTGQARQVDAQARKAPSADWFSVNASSRCSTVMNSWRCSRACL
ncbi:hypothetical protein RLIN73S_03885 [Rhodanobacter lindaniclasticus]